MKMNTRRAGGFTLIELMIVVAIIGILGAIAYPAYTEQVRKGKRADARAALMNLLQQEERYMTQRNKYLDFTAGLDDGSIPFKAYSGSVKATSSHLLGARACTPIGGVTPEFRDCIEVFAQPHTGVFTDPEITTMAIDTQGRRRCDGTNTTRCWQ